MFDSIRKIIRDEIEAALPGAINAALRRTVKMVDGKSDPGQQNVVEREINVIDFLVQYLPDIERRMAGVQSQVSIVGSALVPRMDAISDKLKIVDCINDILPALANKQHPMLQLDNGGNNDNGNC